MRSSSSLSLDGSVGFGHAADGSDDALSDGEGTDEFGSGVQTADNNNREGDYC
jgi:hypothetical protein